MNKRINIHIRTKNMHKNEKSSRHLGRKWYHGTIQSQKVGCAAAILRMGF